MPLRRLASGAKKYASCQPCSLLLAIAIAVVSLIPLPTTPLNAVPLIDKWTHIVMYGALAGVIAAEYGRRTSVVRWRRLLLFGLLAPIVMGCVLEVAQTYLTGGVRTGDWLDVAANIIGAAIGFSVGIPLARFLATRNKDACSGNDC